MSEKVRKRICLDRAIRLCVFLFASNNCVFCSCSHHGTCTMIFSGRGCVPRAHLAGRACSAGGRARPVRAAPSHARAPQELRRHSSARPRRAMACQRAPTPRMAWICCRVRSVFSGNGWILFGPLTLLVGETVVRRIPPTNLESSRCDRP